MTFRVGQKVVCVDDSLSVCGVHPIVTRGTVYTVAAVRPFTGAIILAEVPYPHAAIKAGHTDWWKASRFSAVERPTDISIFTKMLTPERVLMNRLIPLNDPKLRMLRVASASRYDKHGMGGREKTGGYIPAPITLPRVMFLERGELSEYPDSN